MSQVAASTLDGPTKLRLGFDGGTLLIEGLPEGDTLGLPGVRRLAVGGQRKLGRLWAGFVIRFAEMEGQFMRRAIEGRGLNAAAGKRTQRRASRDQMPDRARSLDVRVHERKVA